MEAEEEEEEATANLGPRNLTRTWVVVVVVVGIWFFLPCVLVYTQTFFFFLQSNPLGERMSYVQLVSFVFVISRWMGWGGKVYGI